MVRIAVGKHWVKAEYFEDVVSDLAVHTIHVLCGYIIM